MSLAFHLKKTQEMRTEVRRKKKKLIINKFTQIELADFFSSSLSLIERYGNAFVFKAPAVLFFFFFS